tara:strand:- start:297 stop:497 length:201 start_codon:yes stop_codon:yes gene_type:complete
MQEANAVANFGVEFIAWINTAERQNAGTIWQAKLLAPRLPLYSKRGGVCLRLYSKDLYTHFIISTL